MSTAVLGSYDFNASESSRRFFKNSALSGYDPGVLYTIPDVDVQSEELISPSLLHPPHYDSDHTGNFSLLPHLDTHMRASPPSGSSFELDSATSVSSDSYSPPNEMTPTRKDLNKPRRRRQKVELAPDQPLTTQGKARTRVFSACLQCRSRKTRCDGGKPACHNCTRRPSDEGCTYDEIPNRRGPDREPGARQRVKDSPVEPRRRRRRTLDMKKSPSKEKEASDNRSSPTVLPSAAAVSSPPEFSAFLEQNYDPGPPSALDDTGFMPDLPALPIVLELNDPVMDLNQVLNAPLYSQDLISSQKLEIFDSYVFSTSSAYIMSYQDEDSDTQDNKEPISSGPSIDFSRQTWWDSLLYSYSFLGHPSSNMSSADREVACQQITSDMRFLFRSTHYWFCFFNVPRFFAVFSNPEKRARMQPSLILAALAISTFLQSSEVEMGAKGRKKAMRLRDEAQGALEASFNAGWLDESLVQAAWLIAFFEICAHPYHSSERVVSAVVILDSLVRSMGLTALDAGDPRTTTFVPGAPPIVRPQLPGIELEDPVKEAPHTDCECASHSLGKTWSMAQTVTPLWVSTPAWTEEVSESEMRKEECRRLVWSSVMLVAGHSSYSAAHLQSPSLDLFLIDPSNYALLLPGESLSAAGPKAKDSIWSLYVRAMMLWNSCLKMRRDSGVSDAEKAQFAMSAWLETYTLEDALNKHTCDIERSYMFLGREYLFNTRMAISYEFQRFAPHVTANVNAMFNRKKADEWLTHQAAVVKHLMYGLHRVTGQAGGSIVHRPFFVFWFMGQISRALTLWTCDNALTVALDVSKAMMAPVEYLMSLWPCNTQRLRYEKLRDRLESACIVAGVTPPAQSKVSLGHFAS